MTSLSTNPILDIDTTINLWLSNLSADTPKPPPEEQEVTDLKNRFIALKDIGEWEFYRCKNQLIAIYEIFGYKAPSDLTSFEKPTLSQRTLHPTRHPLLSSALASGPLPGPTERLEDLDLDTIFDIYVKGEQKPVADSPSTTESEEEDDDLEIELKDVPEFSTSPLPPHIHFFKLVLEIHNEIILNPKSTTDKTLSLHYVERLNALIRHDFVGKSLRRDCSQDELDLLFCYLDNMLFLYEELDFYPPKNISNLIASIAERKKLLGQKQTIPEILFDELENVIYESISPSSKTSLIQLYQTFLQSITSLPEVEAIAFLKIINIKLFNHFNLYWMTHLETPFPAEFSKFIHVRDPFIFDWAYPQYELSESTSLDPSKYDDVEIILKDIPTYKQSPLSPHLHLFSLILEIRLKLAEKKDCITDPVEIYHYASLLKDLISHDFIGKSLREESNIEKLQFLIFCVDEIVVLHNILHIEVPKNIAYFYQMIHASKGRIIKLSPISLSEISKLLTKIFNEKINPDTLSSLKHLIQEFLNSLTTLDEKELRAYSQMINLKLFSHLTNYWKLYNFKWVQQTLSGFLKFNQYSALAGCYPKSKLKRKTLASSFLPAPSDKGGGSSAASRFEEDRSSLPLKKQAHEPAKASGPAGAGGPSLASKAPEVFEIDLERPITIKSSGSHFTDFENGLKALHEENYGLALEYIILSIKFYDKFLLHPNRFPPALECDKNSKAFYIQVYRHVSIIMTVHDPKLLLSQHKVIMETLENHKKGIQDYLKEHNPIEQITPILNRYIEACNRAFNCKLMLLEDKSYSHLTLN
jgi:hypothetical protein